jgi:ferritin
VADVEDALELLLDLRRVVERRILPVEGMAKQARDEGFGEIADWFETLAKAERSHANRFQKALDALSD